MYCSLGTKGRHSNVPPEKPKSEPAPVNVPSPVESPKVEEPPAPEYTPPDPNLVEQIKVIETANVATAPPVKNIVICKNCKAEEYSLKLDERCLYHRGAQVYVD